jgi:uncharacterized protein YjdB
MNSRDLSGRLAKAFRTTRRNRLLLGVIALAFVAVPRVSIAQTIKWGDVNGDGTVGAVDAQAILTAVVGLPLPAGFTKANGDANCDGAIGAIDAQIVLSYVVSLNVAQFCVGTPIAAPVASVSVSLAASALTVGATTQATALLKDVSGNVLTARTVAWTSGTPAVATINSATGIISAVAAGTSQITAAVEGQSGNAILTVTAVQVPVATVSVSAPSSAPPNIIVDGATSALLKDASGNVLTGRTIAWSSSVPAVATIDANGRITTKSAGSTTFTATSEGKSGSAPFFVRVPATLSASSVNAQSAAPGTKLQPSIVVTDASGNPVGFVSVAFSVTSGGGSVDPSLASTDNFGVGTVNWTLGATPGTNTLTASSVALSGSPISFTATTSLSSSGTQFVSIFANAETTCGLKQDGAAYCWGSNRDGQVGNSATTDQWTPAPVGLGLAFKTLSVGYHHVCGISVSGGAYCWGRNTSGQLGDGTTSSRSTPIAVSGGLVFTSIAAGFHHTCGLTQAGKAYCWGSSSDYGLGNGEYGFGTHSYIPVGVAGALVFRSLVAGYDRTCGVTVDAIAYCWGDGSGGANGDNVTNGTYEHYSVPVQVAGGLKFSALAAGENHTCGLTVSGTAYCWGANGLGELGDGTTTTRYAPSPVSGGRTFAQLVAGGYQTTCALTSAGDAYCWGGNYAGAAGIGTDRSPLTAPTAVAGGLAIRTIVTGDFHTCAITLLNTPYCWGQQDQGEFGDPTVKLTWVDGPGFVTYLPVPVKWP